VNKCFLKRSFIIIVREMRLSVEELGKGREGEEVEKREEESVYRAQYPPSIKRSEPVV